MILRTLSVAGVLTLGLGLSIALAAAPDPTAAPLILALPAGTLQRVAETAFVQPFDQVLSLATTIVPLAAGETAPPVHADITLVDGQTLLAGCKAGTLQKLDWSAIGNRDRLLGGAATDCGAGAWVRGSVLAWSRDKFSGTPTWSDFWDVARIPGKRGLRRGARGNLEFALIADGVAPGDVYGTLKDSAGVERAFRKLDQLKPYLVWWRAEEEAPGLLASGDVLMTSAPAEGVLAAAKGTSGVAPRDFAVQWAGGLFRIDSFAVPTGATAAAAAVRLLKFTTDPHQQAHLSGFPGFGSAVTGGTDSLGAAEKADSPSTPANLASGLMADEGFWHDNEVKLDKQFEAWLARP